MSEVWLGPPLIAQGEVFNHFRLINRTSNFLQLFFTANLRNGRGSRSGVLLKMDALRTSFPGHPAKAGASI